MREDLINGILELPLQFFEILNTDNEVLDDMFQAIWLNFLNGKDTDTLVWYKQFDDHVLFNKFLYHLSKAGWVESTINNNYATIQFRQEKLLKWLTKDEIFILKKKHKLLKYRLTASASRHANRVKINGKFKETGLVRKGFQKVGNHRFKYDTEMLEKYIKPIAQNLWKGLSADYNEISYKEVIIELVSYYAMYDRYYTLGDVAADSRGRSIFSATSKIFNPIGSKDARALLVTEPQPLEPEALDAIYAGIAELLGYSADTWEDKIELGALSYEHDVYLDLDLDTIKGRDDLHKNIWLERIYNAIESYDGSNWDVPIEIDATASFLQILGLLLDYEPYVRLTNVAESNTIQDIWSIDGLTRNMVKKCMTPRLYGSSQTTEELWDKNKVKYTKEQLDHANSLVEEGIFKTANDFKDFVIGNCKPKEEMQIRVWKDDFFIECNRFQNYAGDIDEYRIYQTSLNTLKDIKRTVERIPDLKQFKRFFQTCLCHNLDSQIMNAVDEQLDWCISIHDAVICHPSEILKAKTVYAEQLEELYKDRESILKNYFKSIGITQKWKESDKPIGELKVSLNALK